MSYSFERTAPEFVFNTLEELVEYYGTTEVPGLGCTLDIERSVQLLDKRSKKGSKGPLVRKAPSFVTADA